MAEYTIRNAPFDTGNEPVGIEVFKAGIVSGLVGGVLMAAWAMLATAAQGLGLFAIPQLIGAAFRGPEALLQGPGVIVWGVVLHLIMSAAFGILFATLGRRDTP